jgi:hypothetical protein
MPIYISRGRFTSGAVKGMLAKPENREEAVAKLFKSVGGRLIGWYLTLGRHARRMPEAAGRSEGETADGKVTWLVDRCRLRDQTDRFPFWLLDGRR